MNILYPVFFVALFGGLSGEKCRALDLPDVFSLGAPRFGDTIVVGDQLAETLTSIVCKIKNHRDWLLKTTGLQKGTANLSLAGEATVLKEIEDLQIAPKLIWQGSIDGTPVIVEELIEGSALNKYAERLRDSHKFSTEILSAGVAIIQALKKLHTQYIHGDLHSGNVIVTGPGQVKLIDFGRAVKIDELKRYQYESPFWWLLSPWALQGRPLDKRDDIFGVIMSISNLLNWGATRSFYERLAYDRKKSIRRKRHSRDLFNPESTEPGPLSRLVQGMLANRDPPYDEIIAHLIKMQARPSTVGRIGSAIVTAATRLGGGTKAAATSAARARVSDACPGLSDEELLVDIKGSIKKIWIGARATDNFCEVEGHPEYLLKVEIGSSLLHEATVLRDIERLHIAPRVFWQSEIERNSVMLLENLKGRTLDIYYPQYAHVKGFWNRWIQIGIEMIQILKELHGAKYVHSDIHAKSFMIQRYTGRVKLTGTESVVNVMTTRLTSQPYSPPLDWILSPWEIRGEALSKRDDIFRVVLLISNMLTGGETQRFFEMINDHSEACAQAKAGGLDLFHLTEAPQDLSLLVQSMNPGDDVPYEEIIFLLDSMKKQRDDILENDTMDTPAVLIDDAQVVTHAYPVLFAEAIPYSPSSASASGGVEEIVHAHSVKSRLQNSFPPGASAPPLGLMNYQVPIDDTTNASARSIKKPSMWKTLKNAVGH